MTVNSAIVRSLPATSEFELHLCVVQMLRLFAAPNVIWFHPPNGEYRSKRTGSRLKLMGVRKGVADLVIIRPGGKVAFLELKRDKGRASPDQLQFAGDCADNGCDYWVARTPEDAAAALYAFGALSENPFESKRGTTV